MATQRPLIITRRVTSSFLQAIPPQIEHFDAYLYAVVKRKPEKVIQHRWGKDVRLDPCVFDWERKTITVTIPRDINPGIDGLDDLEPSFFEALQAAFIAFMHGCLP